MMKFISGLIVAVVLVFVAVNLAGNIVLAKVMENTLGVDVNVRRVQLGLFAQQAGIYGLKVHNPDGFQEELLASIPEISLQYDLGDILKNRIHIKELRLNLDEITVERNARNQFNLTELQAMKSSGQTPSGPGEEKKEKAPSAKPGKRMDLLIDEVRLSLGRVRYVDTSQGKATIKEFPLEIEDLVLRHVTDPRQVVQQIVIKTMQKVGLNALMPDLGQFSAVLNGETASQMKEGFGAFAQKVLGAQSS